MGDKAIKQGKQLCFEYLSACTEHMLRFHLINSVRATFEILSNQRLIQPLNTQNLRSFDICFEY